jgi:hypothetical protein
VAGCCKYGDEPVGSIATELVSYCHRWSMLEEKSQASKKLCICPSLHLYLLSTAPAGALMYYRELQGDVRSFNYGTSVGK